MDKLPPNMRKPSDCPRERRPVELEFMVDGQSLYHATEQPSGLWNDGESTFYARFPVSGGQHRLFIGMRDSGRETGFDYELETGVTLVPEQHLVIEFDSERRAFVLNRGNPGQSGLPQE
jgi:hypothetical protein